MNNRIGKSGFTLITAIFLLVVVGGLMGYMVNLRVLQQSTVVMAVQGARALQAARSGLEYGMYRALLPPNSCSTGELVTMSDQTLSAFTVTVDCIATSHDEGGTVFNVYTLTALAENGVFALGGNANPDYISRRLRVTVSEPPP